MSRRAYCVRIRSRFKYLHLHTHIRYVRYILEITSCSAQTARRLMAVSFASNPPAGQFLGPDSNSIMYTDQQAQFDLELASRTRAEGSFSRIAILTAVGTAHGSSSNYGYNFMENLKQYLGMVLGYIWKVPRISLGHLNVLELCRYSAASLRKVRTLYAPHLSRRHVAYVTVVYPPNNLFACLTHSCKGMRWHTG